MDEGDFWLQIAMGHIAALERRVDALRSTDLEAVKLRHQDLSARLEQKIDYIIERLDLVT